MFKPSLLAASVAACSSFAFAAETVLPTVVVAASRLSSLPAGTPLYVIDQATIQQSPAQSIADLLTSIPGISSRKLANGFGEASIDVRGFGAAASVNTLILVNGRRLNDVDLSAANLSGIPLSAIERIEVMPGGGSVLYGDGASGGTINIITKQATANAASVALTAGSFASQDLQASGNIVSGTSAVRLSGRHAESDGYRDNTASNQDSVELDAQTKHGQHTWFINAQASQDDNRLAGVRKVNPATGVDELHTDPKGTSTPHDYAEEKKYQAWAGWKFAFADNMTLIIDGSRRDKTQNSFYGDYAFGGTYDSYADTQLVTDALTPRFQMTYRWGQLENTLRTGIDWYKTDYVSHRGQKKHTEAVHTINIESESQSAYLLQSSRFDQTTLTVGARTTKVEQSATDVFNAQATGADPFDAPAPSNTQKYEDEMYEVGINQVLGLGFTAMLNASRSVRFGTVDETYEYDANFMRTFSPLLPQVGKNIEASLTYDHDKGHVTATVYRQKLKNEIHFSPTTFTNDNLDPTQREGITLAASFSLPMNVQLNGSLTRQSAEFKEGAFAGHDVPLVAKNLASLGVNWQPITALNLALTDTYTGSKRLDNDQSNDFETTIADYHRLDAKASYRVANWQASVSLLNLTGDKDYYEYGVRTTSPGKNNYNVYPLAGREYRISVSYDF